MAAKPLAELFERQERRWEIERRAGMPAPRGAVVSISRQPWALGDEVAERVAAWLDYGLFGLETLREIAREPSLRARLEADLEPSSRAAIAARLRQILGAVEEQELRDVAAVVAVLGERGMAVVVGRGALSILPEQRTLRVLVVAPRPARLRRLAEATGQEQEAADARLRAEDEERLVFLRERLGLPGDEPDRYDLVINSEALPPDAAAALVVEAVRRRFPPAPS